MRGRGRLLVWAALAAGGACVNLSPPAQRDGGTPDGPETEAAAERWDGSGEHDWSDADGDAAEAAGGAGGSGSTLRDGLVGYWKLDEPAGTAIAADSSDAMRNSGSIVGSPGRVTSALPPVSFSDGGAFSFGMNDWVEVPDDPSLRPAAISIAVWVKLTNLTASAVCGAASNQMQYLVHRRNTRGAAGMFEGVALLKDGATFRLLLSSASTGAQGSARSTTAPAVGAWVHLVGTYDGASRIQMFVNGSLEGTGAFSGAIDYDPTRPLFIARTGECGGAGEALWDAHLAGALDDVRIYNRVLSATEVMRLYAGSD